jgi:hypothetical protein
MKTLKTMKSITITVATIIEAASANDEDAVAVAVVNVPGGRCNHADGRPAMCSWYSDKIIFRSERKLANMSPGISGPDNRFMASGSYLGELGRWFAMSVTPQ